MFSDDTIPVYAISVAAQLSGLHPQTLRQYDKLGLVSPQRTNGRNRLYSARDIARLQEVADLSAAGVSLEGIRRVLDLQAEVERLRDELEGYVAEKRSTALVLWNPSRRRGA
ncbi:MAG: MerR family transcriptional regulator [Actinobacteria bacterium]|nr:MerR family transcriptional regulator [Actinomycetota bacterium]